MRVNFFSNKRNFYLRIREFFGNLFLSFVHHLFECFIALLCYVLLIFFKIYYGHVFQVFTVIVSKEGKTSN